jgi:hypothetical protein
MNEGKKFRVYPTEEQWFIYNSKVGEDRYFIEMKLVTFTPFLPVRDTLPFLALQSHSVCEAHRKVPYR